MTLASWWIEALLGDETTAASTPVIRAGSVLGVLGAGPEVALQERCVNTAAGIHVIRAGSEQLIRAGEQDALLGEVTTAAGIPVIGARNEPHMLGAGPEVASQDLGVNTAAGIPVIGAGSEPEVPGAGPDCFAELGCGGCCLHTCGESRERATWASCWA